MPIPSRTAEWVERMRGVHVLEVATALGIATSSARGGNGGAMQCLACGAERRHTKTRDKRLAVGIRKGGGGWSCFQCDESGDQLDLVAFHRGGKRYRDLSDTRKAEVREWCSRWLGLDITRSNSSRASSAGDATTRTLPPPAARRPDAPRIQLVEQDQPPLYPPFEEVEALWNLCRRVDEVPEVADWLRSKRVDPTIVADRDLGRALPPTTKLRELPAWTHMPLGSSKLSHWASRGYLFITLLFDAHGVRRSVIARNVRGAEPKSFPPWPVRIGKERISYARRGLVLACGLGREILSTGQRPEWWPTNEPLRFEIAEGEKKWVMRAADRADSAELAPAVLGIESGAWTAEVAARIPDDSNIYIASDPDDAGAQYAQKIVQSLEERWRSGAVRLVLRTELQLDTDDNDNKLIVRVREA